MGFLIDVGWVSSRILKYELVRKLLVEGCVANEGVQLLVYGGLAIGTGKRGAAMTIIGRVTVMRAIELDRHVQVHCHRLSH
jgi:hypothetical protein